MSSLKITKCEGEGQGSCKRCTDRGIWNRDWMCFLYKIEGYEGFYCLDCVKEMEKEESNDLISRKALMEYAERDSNFRLVTPYDKVVSAPTAYGVDAVCKELEEYLFDKYCIEGDSTIDDIVRNGGKKNDSTADF